MIYDRIENWSESRYGVKPAGNALEFYVFVIWSLLTITFGAGIVIALIHSFFVGIGVAIVTFYAWLLLTLSVSMLFSG